MPKLINIGLLDDHQIVIDGLIALLKNVENIEVKFVCNDSMTIEEKLSATNIDILLTDVMMPGRNGFEVAKIIREQFPTLKVIVLTMSGNGKHIKAMIDEAHIHGYLLKTCSKVDLVKAIETVYQGGKYFVDEIWRELETYNEQLQHLESLNLTPREIEIMKQLALGKSNKQIANDLIISEHTVDSHRKNIYRKSGAHSVVELLDFARNHGFLD
ncbi:MAG: response regulator transcription factor [Chitinophagales bacterium]|nr:response regulator transcription factor [Chitinophagales bacterium]